MNGTAIGGVLPTIYDYNKHNRNMLPYQQEFLTLYILVALINTTTDTHNDCMCLHLIDTHTMHVLIRFQHACGNLSSYIL